MRVRRLAHSLRFLFLLPWLSMLAGPQDLKAQTTRGNAVDIPTGVLQGRVVDSSAAVLPGVVITVVSADNKPLGSAVTGGSGEFTLGDLPLGNVSLTFHLDGFT